MEFAFLVKINQKTQVDKVKKLTLAYLFIFCCLNNQIYNNYKQQQQLKFFSPKDLQCKYLLELNKLIRGRKRNSINMHKQINK